MTVQELIDRLKQFPINVEVRYMETTGFKYVVESVKFSDNKNMVVLH